MTAPLSIEKAGRILITAAQKVPINLVSAEDWPQSLSFAETPSRLYTYTYQLIVKTTTRQRADNRFVLCWLCRWLNICRTLIPPTYPPAPTRTRTHTCNSHPRTPPAARSHSISATPRTKQIHEKKLHNCGTRKHVLTSPLYQQLALLKQSNGCLGWNRI